MIQTFGLVKQYKNLTAVDHLDLLALPPGAGGGGS